MFVKKTDSKINNTLNNSWLLSVTDYIIYAYYLLKYNRVSLFKIWAFLRYMRGARDKQKNSVRVIWERIQCRLSNCKSIFLKSDLQWLVGNACAIVKKSQLVCGNLLYSNADFIIGTNRGLKSFFFYLEYKTFFSNQSTKANCVLSYRDQTS